MDKITNQILINNHISEPINCKAIILGDRRQKFNPATKEYHDTGDGKIIWQIGQHRQCGHFLLAYENSRTQRD